MKSNSYSTVSIDYTDTSVLSLTFPMELRYHLGLKRLKYLSHQLRVHEKTKQFFGVTKDHIPSLQGALRCSFCLLLQTVLWSAGDSSI